MRFATRGSVSLMLVALSGCGAFESTGINTIDDFPWPGHPKSEQVRGAAAQLTLISAEGVSSPAADFPVVPGVDFLRECGSPVAVSPRGIGTVVAGALASAAIGYVAAAVDTRLENEINRYEARWSAGASGYFYRDRFGGLESRCFRVRRSIEGRNVFDFIGQFDVSPEQAAVRIRPLYLRYEATKARTGNAGGFSAVMALHFDAVWLEPRGTGLARTARAFSAVLPFGQLSLADEAQRIPPPATSGVASVPRAWAASTWFPAIPYSRDLRGNRLGNGSFNMTVEVHEAATARDLAADILGVVRSGVSRSRQAAIEAVAP